MNLWGSWSKHGEEGRHFPLWSMMCFKATYAADCSREVHFEAILFAWTKSSLHERLLSKLLEGDCGRQPNSYFITIVHACGRIKTQCVLALNVTFLLWCGSKCSVSSSFSFLHFPQTFAFAFVGSNYIHPVTRGWYVWMTQRFREGAYSTNEARTLGLHKLIYYGIISSDFSTFKMRPSVLGVQGGFYLTAWFPCRCPMGES